MLFLYGFIKIIFLGGDSLRGGGGRSLIDILDRFIIWDIYEKFVIVLIWFKYLKINLLY